MAEPVRLGVIGAGAIAEAYRAALDGAAFAVVTAVADTDPAAAGRFADKAGCPSFTSHQALLDAGACDAAIVCTPPNAHAGIACDLMQGGLSVLVEKPLCLGQEDAARIAQVARETGTVMTMASKFRFVPDFAHACALVADGAIGTPLRVENWFTSRVDMATRWNARPEISGGGVLIDNGTHSVDIVRALAGPLAAVLAVEGPRLQSPSVEDSATLLAETADGVLATAHLSWSSDERRETWLEVSGSAGRLELGWRFARLRRNGEEDWTSIGGGYDKLSALRAQLADFCQAVRGDGAPAVSVDDALASVAAVQAAYRSIKQRRWVSVAQKTGAAAAE